MARQRRDRLFARGIKDPPLEAEPAAGSDERAYRLGFVTQVGHPDGVRGVARKTADRVLVVEHADRDFVSAEAANDAQALVVAADHDRADRGGGGVTRR